MSDTHNTFSYAHYFILAVVWIYIFQSSIPHGLTNLAQAKQSLSYKIGQTQEYAAIFEAHNDYVPILFHLNITPDKREELLQTYKKQFALLVNTSDIQNKDALFEYIKGIHTIGELHSAIKQIQKTSPKLYVSSEFQ